jgi:mxaJ protein
MGRRRSALIVLLIALLVFLTPAQARAQTQTQPRPLRVCADPNNMPFSNQAREGFENRIIEDLARHIGAEVEYIWWAQRRGYVREALNARQCDVIPGVAANLEMLLTTRPYYRSTYVFAWRRDHDPHVTSLDDPRLGSLRIGVQMIGDDFSNTPPAHALARRGYVQNVRGYMVYGDYEDEAPAAPIMRALATGDIDVAIVWGPVAGYFASRVGTPLSIAPIEPQLDPPGLPMTFEISMGVRRDDPNLRAELNRALIAQQSAIDQILSEYDVPRL